MESYVQKLAKKREPTTITVLPVLQEERAHEDGCGGGSCGCGDDADGGCCGG
jgi:hypothetical protein